MAQLINLYGVQTLTPTTDNNFSLIYDGNVRSENNNEVRILVDTSLQVVPAPVNIYIPPTNSFRGIWTLQLYVVDVSGSAGTNPINIIATGGDNIDGVASTQVSSNYGNCVLTIASLGYWTSYGSASGGGGGGGGMITTTYANFYNTMSQGNLIAGANYRITDYQSKNFINGWNTANNNPSPANLNAGQRVTTFNNPSTATNSALEDGGIFCLPDGTSFYANYDKVRKYDVNGVEIPSFFANQGSGGGSNSVYGINVQSSGKVVLVGNFNVWDGNPVGYIVRLNADGTYDPTFTANIGTGFDTTIYSLDIQTDDSIVVGGAFGFLNGVANNFLARILSDGTPDLVFNANLMVGGGFNQQIRKVIIQPDTNILVCGVFTSFNAIPISRITRLDTFGNSDVIFDGNINFAGGFNGSISTMALQTDGSIIVSGFFTNWNGNAYNQIARMFFDGSDDVGFNLACGTGLTSPSGSIAIQNDGYILLSTSANALFDGNAFLSLCRIDPFGIFDTAFIYTLGFYGYPVKIQPTTNYILISVNGGEWYYALYPTPIINPDFDARQIYTSPNVETLIVKATDGFNIEQNVYSEQYPLDIIQYLPQVNNLGFAWDYQTGNADPNGNPIVDFNVKWDGTRAYFDMPIGFPVQMGQFCYVYCTFNGSSYSLDVLAEPILFGVNEPMDYNDGDLTDAHSTIEANSSATRIYLNGITNAQFLQYDLDSLYVNCVYAYEPTTGWITRRNYTAWNINFPTDWRNQVFRRYGVSIPQANYTANLYFNDSPSLPLVSIGGYTDYPTLYRDAYSIQFTGTGGASPWWYTGYNDNNVLSNSANISGGDYFEYNTVLSTFGYAKFGVNCNQNCIDSQTQDCVFGNNTQNNIFVNGSFNNCLFADYVVSNRHFGSNLDSNDFGLNYANNILTNTSFYASSIGNGFQQNTITDSLIEQIVVGEQSASNTIINSEIRLSKYDSYFSSNSINNCQILYNTWSNRFFNNILTGTFTFINGGSDFEGNNFSGNTTECTFGNRTKNNIVSLTFERNLASDDFISNTFSSAFNYENVFGNRFITNTITGGSFYKNLIGNNSINNTFTNAVFHDNSFGFGFSNNLFQIGQFYNCSAGNNFASNQIASLMIYTSFGNDCNSNFFLGQTSGNVFGDFCQSNACGGSSNLQENVLSLNFSSNTIDSIFHNNTISALCQQNTFPFVTIGNTITGTDFNQNAIATTFSNNVISYTMSNCITAGGGGVSFRFNDIQSDLLGVDFTLSTFVYANYNKTIQKGSLGTSILTYWDEGTNTYNWALPTA